MEELAKFITDERTGLKYELCGDYYIIAGEEESEREPIGVWGHNHLKYIQKHCKPFYTKMHVQCMIIYSNSITMPKICLTVW